MDLGKQNSSGHSTQGVSFTVPPAIGPDGTVYVGSNDSYLYAINLDGTLKWKFLTGDMVASSPAIGSDGTVYVGSRDHHLYALTSEGTLKWKFQTGFFIHYSSPVIGLDGTVYIGSGDAYLYVINADGTLKWKFATLGSIHSSPAIDSDGVVYVGSYRCVYSLNPDSSQKYGTSFTGEIILHTNQGNTLLTSTTFSAALLHPGPLHLKG